MGMRVTREILLATVVLAHLAYSWMFSDITVPNERTRSYLAVALVDHHTISVDEPMQRFGRVYDLASFGGHYYTDKAPGSSFLAAPVYAIAKLLSPHAEWTIVDIVQLFRTWLMLPIGLCGFLLLRVLLRARNVSSAVVDTVSLGYVLGSVAFHYSTAFYGHAMVATFALAALVCLERAGLLDASERTLEAGSSRLHWLIGAGLFAGLMGLVEYQAIVMSCLFALPILLHREQRVSGLLAYALGGAPSAAALLVYNAYAFGGPLELSYHHLVGSELQDLHGMGLAGATHPTWNAFSGLLFSLHRGLVSTSPLMGIGLCALIVARRSIARPLRITLSACTLYFLLIVSSSSVWYGGWSFGPRLLVPVAPLCALAAGLWIGAHQQHPWLEGIARAAVCFGVLYQQLVHAFFAELPPEFKRPISDVVGPMLAAELVSPNLMCKLQGLHVDNLLPLVILVSAVIGWVAFAGAKPRRPDLLRGAGVLTSSALLLIALAWLEPSIPQAQQDSWIRLVESWADHETRCRK